MSVIAVFGVAAASRNTRFQAARYDLTWVGLAPADRASSAWRLHSFDHFVGASGQGSRSFELRATTSLARVLSDQGRHAEAHAGLRNIYRFFDAGCGAADLADAKTLLDELPSASQTS